MSYVNNVILTFDRSETSRDKMKDINSNLAGYGQSFFPRAGDCDGWYLGLQPIERPVFIGAFNHVSADEILGAIKATRWRKPKNVRVFFCGQMDDAFEQIWPGRRKAAVSFARLKELEWSSNDNDFEPCCPVCGGARPSKPSPSGALAVDNSMFGHSESCWLATMLRSQMKKQEEV